MLRRFLVSGSAIALLSGAAFAADLPTMKAPPAPQPMAPVVSWTGLYIGVNAGYGGDQFSYPYSIPGFVTGSASITSSGFIGGVQAGYNYQFATSWVGGIEADIDAADIKGQIAVNGNFPGGSFSASGGSQTNYIGTVRARLGYLITDRLLAFGTGGFAYGDAKTSANISFGGPPVFSWSKTNTPGGWTIGGGVEYMIAPNWTFKTEYLYTDLGTGTLASGFAGAGSSVKVHATDNIVRAGLNYKFF